MYTLTVVCYSVIKRKEYLRHAKTVRDLNAYYQVGKSMQKDLHNILTPSSVPRTGKKDQSVEGWKGREGRRGEQAEHRGLLGSESNMYDNPKWIHILMHLPKLRK